MLHKSSNRIKLPHLWNVAGRRLKNEDIDDDSCNIIILLKLWNTLII